MSHRLQLIREAVARDGGKNCENAYADRAWLLSELDASREYAKLSEAVVKAARGIRGMGDAVIREVASGMTYNLSNTGHWQELAAALDALDRSTPADLTLAVNTAHGDK